MKKVFINIIFTVLLVGLLSACGTPEAEQISDSPSTESVIQTEAPTGTSEPTAAPTDTSAPTTAPIGTSEPTTAPVGTSEPTTAPAGTSEPTTAPTVAPTATPAPTPTPTPNASNTPAPSATPAPSVNVPSNNTDTKSENKTETQAPEVTTTPEPTPTPSNSPNVSNTIRESISIGEAGSYISDTVLASHPEIAPRPTLNKNYTLDEAMTDLNKFVFDVYGRTFFENGVGLNYPGGDGAKMLKTADGTWGMQIISWRKSYDSHTEMNMTLNVVFEGMRYLIGDAQVASSLWKVVDYMAIHNGNIPNSLVESYGFTIVSETSAGFTLSMNGHTIRNERGGYYYFS